MMDSSARVGQGHDTRNDCTRLCHHHHRRTAGNSEKTRTAMGEA